MAKQKRLELKDKIAISFSFIALLISGATAFFSVLRVQDDVRVVVDDLPFLALDPVQKAITVTRAGTFIFINAGTRGAVINEIRLNINQSGVKALSTENSCVSRATIFTYDIEPFVVKAGEIITKKTKLNQKALLEISDNSANSSEEGENSMISLSTENQGRETVPLLVCMQINFTTPDSDYNTVALYEYNDEARRNDFGYTTYRENVGKRPKQLVKKSSIIFLAD